METGLVLPNPGPFGILIGIIMAFAGIKEGDFFLFILGALIAAGSLN